MFKVGDKVRRISGSNRTTPLGFEGVIREVRRDPGDDLEYSFDGGAWGYHETCGQVRFELVQPVGPVVTETVTKTRIVPGVYGRVQVVTYVNSDRMDLALLPGRTFTPDELDAAAAVLSELAKGLRDA